MDPNLVSNRSFGAGGASLDLSRSRTSWPSEGLVCVCVRVCVCVVCTELS